MIEPIAGPWQQIGALKTLGCGAADTASRLALVPAIRRAREFRLYDQSGRRFVDCWLDGGRFLFGHRPRAFGKQVKNRIDRGPAYPLPTVEQRRLERHLRDRFPGYTARLFGSVESCLRALGSDTSELPARTAVWRPFEPTPDPGLSVVVAMIPGVLLSPCFVVLVTDELQNYVGASDILDPVMLQSTISGLTALLRAENSAATAKPQTESVHSAQFGEAYWQLFQVSRFRRSGPFLYPPVELWDDEAYDVFFARALALGVIVSPSPRWPSVLPAIASAGERRFVASAFALMP